MEPENHQPASTTEEGSIPAQTAPVYTPGPITSTQDGPPTTTPLQNTNTGISEDLIPPSQHSDVESPIQIVVERPATPPPAYTPMAITEPPSDWQPEEPSSPPPPPITPPSPTLSTIASPSSSTPLPPESFPTGLFPLKIRTQSATLDSGFPYHPSLFDLRIPPRPWSSFSDAVVHAAKLKTKDKAACWAAGVGTALAAGEFITGYLVYRTVQQKKQTERIRKGREDFRRGNSGRLDPSVKGTDNESILSAVEPEPGVLMRAQAEGVIDPVEKGKEKKKEKEKEGLGAVLERWNSTFFEQYGVYARIEVSDWTLRREERQERRKEWYKRTGKNPHNSVSECDLQLDIEDMRAEKREGKKKESYSEKQARRREARKFVIVLEDLATVKARKGDQPADVIEVDGSSILELESDEGALSPASELQGDERRRSELPSAAEEKRMLAERDKKTVQSSG